MECNAPLLQKASVKFFRFPRDITNLSEVIIGNGINVISIGNRLTPQSYY